jgi:thiamine kinase
MLDSVKKLLQQKQLLDPSETVKFSQLKGGYSNKVYRLVGQNKDWVIKHYARVSTNPLYPILPADEYQALQEFGMHGLSPLPIKLINDHNIGKILVYHWVEGDIWKDNVESVSVLLCRLHLMPVNYQFRQVAVGFEAIKKQCDWLQNQIPDSFTITERLKGLDLKNPKLADFNLSYIHTDCGPGNLIANSTAVYLIDWQCPAIGDPVEDLVNFSSPAIQILYGLNPLSKTDLKLFIEHYSEKEVVSRYYKLRSVYHRRMAIYCAYREQQFSQSAPEVSRRYHRALTAELDFLEHITGGYHSIYRQ